MSGTLTEEWFLKVYNRTYFQNKEFTASFPAVCTNIFIIIIIIIISCTKSN
jgi:hypothetical protein